MSQASNALLFLVNIILSFVSVIFIARLVFQLLGVNMTNPIAQFVQRFTQPIVSPLQRIFPTIKRFNFSVLAALIIINLLFTSFLFLISASHADIALVGLFSLIQFARQLLDFVFWSMIIQIVFSWLPNAGFHPIAQIVHAINKPLLKPLQKIIPNYGGIDFAPAVILIGVMFLERLIA